MVRTIRHYWQRAKELFETLPMEKAIVEGSIYIDTSDYKLQVEQYLKYFDRSAVLVVSSDDLRDERRRSLNSIFGWLGLAPSSSLRKTSRSAMFPPRLAGAPDLPR